MEPGLSSPESGATARPAPAPTIITASGARRAHRKCNHLSGARRACGNQSGFGFLVGLVVQDAPAVGTVMDGLVPLDLVEQLGRDTHPAALARARFHRDHRQPTAPSENDF